MRSSIARRVAAGAMALGLVAVPAAQAAGSGGEEARLRDARARAEAIHAELTVMLDDLVDATLAADAASERWTQLRLREMEMRAAEEEARRMFAERVRAAYIGGASRAAEMILGANDFAELAARLPYAQTILEQNRLDVRLLAERRQAVTEVLADAESAQGALAAAEERFGLVRAAIERRLADAEADVRANADALALLRAERVRYAGTLERVAGATRSIRRQKGEAMFAAAAPYLGPRADCSIPKGLVSTGDAIGGEASWYGNEFRGKPTASGAIFWPERYTVAHKTLPFGLFLLIKYSGRCVVAFLNDRGPYVDGRILDLSYASAQAIGLTGAKDVTATLLVRAS